MTSTTSPVPCRLSRIRQPGDDAGGAVVLALHGENHTLPKLLEFARTAVPARELVAPIGAWGTYVGAMDLSAYTWFHEVPGVPEPEPTSLGRSLIDVEQLLDELRLDHGPQPRIVLLGAGQGATLALVLARVVPDLLSAVVAVGGRPLDLPPGAVTGVPECPPVPVLWFGEGENAAAVTIVPESDIAPGLTPAVAARVAAWLAEAAG